MAASLPLAMTMSCEEEVLASSGVSVEEQLRAAVEKGEVDQLRNMLRKLLRDSEGLSELAPLLQLACACAETSVRRVELVELLLDKGADPSAVGDGGSALPLAGGGNGYQRHRLQAAREAPGGTRRKGSARL